MQACAGPRRHLTTIVSGQLSGDSRGSAFAFNNLHDAVNTGKDEFLAQAAGPEDFEFVDFGGGAEAEVEAQVGSGRSEERRVGKEWRCRRWTERGKKREKRAKRGIQDTV